MKALPKARWPVPSPEPALPPRGRGGFSKFAPPTRIYILDFPTFKQYVEMREGVLLPDRSPAKGLSRINPFPTTNAHRRRLKPNPFRRPNPFPPAVRAVPEVVPQKLIPKLPRM